MQIIQKSTTLHAQPRLLQWTKTDRSVTTGDFNPSVLHRQGTEIARRAKPNRLGSLKRPKET